MALKEKIRDVLLNPSKVNDVVDIIEELDSKNTSVVLECIDGLGKMFSTWIISGTCPLTSKVSKVSKRKVSDNPEEIFQRWLNQNYIQTVNKLLGLLQSPIPEVKEKALHTLMIFIKAESQRMQENSQDTIFANDLLLKIVEKSTDDLYSNDSLVAFLKPYLQYNDICYYVLKNLSRIILKSSSGTSECGSYFFKNVFHLLLLITIPQFKEELDNLFVIQGESVLTNQNVINHNVMNLNAYKKVFTNAWVPFLGLPLDKALYRQVLIMLEDKVIPHLVDPKILMDFLVDSYDIGGVTSILALNSLFVLIHKYNLDYPDFYKKLYSLFDAEVFHLKYRARFFYLADLFLMSTHLPAYLVAAFIKRLSRLGLSAPPHGVALIITFVGNLICRHPNCQVLIHREIENLNGGDLSESKNKILADPYKEDEADPSQCEALQSSLWELETLRQHYYPQIKDLVELLEKPIGRNETDVSEYFESSYETLFDKECTELTNSNAFIEYHVPKGLLSGSLHELWSINE
ncbi:nucleolar complex protein 4 homolog B-like [Dendronephthya gigantea]|uniref:nucleolar complex protein 4 homolog B-like n=1 Tax=Dendronephthya gigantea TaxID=151771 RepID=UPI00106AA724|nr:nucleolar complex protein 4 homolog B-like [Dendronephthya gigantea]